MGINKKLQAAALRNTMNSPQVYEQIQKNTEKVLKKREKESLIIAKEAVKELINEKYSHLITEGIMECMKELKKECEEVLKDEKPK